MKRLWNTNDCVGVAGVRPAVDTPRADVLRPGQRGLGADDTKNGGILENEIDDDGVPVQRYWIER